MSARTTCEQLTLYGGDITRFNHEQGPRLFEAMFRIRNDPVDGGLRRIALAERAAMLEVSIRFYGMSPDEFDKAAAMADVHARGPDDILFPRQKTPCFQARG
jgi:hypothetical protein